MHFDSTCKPHSFLWSWLIGALMFILQKRYLAFEVVWVAQRFVLHVIYPMLQVLRLVLVMRAVIALPPQTAQSSMRGVYRDFSLYSRCGT